MDGDVEILTASVSQAVTRGKRKASGLKLSKQNYQAEIRIAEHLRRIPRLIEEAVALNRNSVLIGKLVPGVDCEAGSLPQFATLKGVALNLFLKCKLAGLNPSAEEINPGTSGFFISW